MTNIDEDLNHFSDIFFQLDFSNNFPMMARCNNICFTITTIIEVFEFSTNRKNNIKIAGDHRLLIIKFWKMRNHRCEVRPNQYDNLIADHTAIKLMFNSSYF